jgi:OOP family OmpA-OmpF porin
VNITQKENVNGAAIGAPVLLGGFLPTNGNIQGSTGFAGVVSVGWGFGNGLRAEVEGNYRNNHSGGFTNGNGNGGSLVGGGTTEQKYAGMVNVLYDFNGLTPWFVPYLGAGVGYAGINENWHTFNNFGFTAPATTLAATDQTIPPGGLRASGKSTEGSFAYQAIVGAAIPLPSVAYGLAATLEYRFFGTSGNRSYNGTAVATSTTGGVFASPATFRVGSSYNHSILVGLRYNFLPPPPAPPPAAVPAQAPARSYLVFFDWDKYNLTDRARQIIREAADNSTKVQYTRIEVNGYTDTSGTPKYNLGLSIRRANAVKAELIKDGVPANAITAQGFGDTNLLVPTGPGVREPQNRRVEIIIR